jgi:creatinine amidohydrolase
MAASTRHFWWGDFPASAFARIDAEKTIAVLPVAAIEQHGPHLPLSTDADIMQGMLGEVFAHLPTNLDVRVLPIQAIGKSDEHIRHAGTLTIAPAALINAWTDIGASAARAGIRKLVIVNSHGGNEDVIGIVSRELRIRFDMFCVKTSWSKFGCPGGLFSADELRLGIHGGDLETSLMLHFRPDLVDMKKAKNFVSATAKADRMFKHLKPQNPHAFAWLATDLNPAGVVGDAGIATAAKGAQTAIFQAHGFVELLTDIRKAKLADWIRK